MPSFLDRIKAVKTKEDALTFLRSESSAAAATISDKLEVASERLAPNTDTGSDDDIIDAEIVEAPKDEPTTGDAPTS